MEKNKKVYNLSIPGINKDLFNHPLYLNKCEKIDFNGVIKEVKITGENGHDYISLAPKFKPHSDYELMLQSTDSIVKSPITSLTDEAVHYIFTTGYDFVRYFSQKDNIDEFGMDGGYVYLVFNYDEFTTDRHSGMSKKPFHLHLNSWKKDTIDKISIIDKDKVSPFYYQSVVDPIFDLTRILTRDALDCEELNKYLDVSNPICGDQEIYYSSVYKVKEGWKFLESEDFIEVLKLIHNKLEERYKEILQCFSAKTEVPELYTRHLLLENKKIIENITNSKLQESTKIKLLELIDRVHSITPEQFKEISKNTDYRDTLIPLRWLAYSIGFFSNDVINLSSPLEEKDVYMNCTPRLYTKIGGASIMNFPNYSLVKIDRGEGDISELEFENRVKMHESFVRTLRKDRF